MIEMRRLIGILILALIAIVLLIAMIYSLGWLGTLIVLAISGVLYGLIFIAMALIWG